MHRNTNEDLANFRRQLDTLRNRRLLLSSTIQEEKKALREAKAQVRAVLTGQICMQQIAESLQSQAHRQMSKVASDCLSAVFGDPYQLQVEFERKRGKTEASFVYYRDGRRLQPKVASGGVLQVASLALRLVSVLLTTPPVRRFLALDEPFPGLDAENKPKVALLLETLAEKLNVQFLIITHDNTFKIGKVIEL